MRVCIAELYLLGGLGEKPHNAMLEVVSSRPLLCGSLFVDSGGLAFHAIHKSLLLYKGIEKAGLSRRDRDKNRIVRPRHVHDPGIQ